MQCRPQSCTSRSETVQSNRQDHHAALPAHRLPLPRVRHFHFAAACLSTQPLGKQILVSAMLCSMRAMISSQTSRDAAVALKVRAREPATKEEMMFFMVRCGEKVGTVRQPATVPPIYQKPETQAVGLHSPAFSPSSSAVLK